MDYDDEKLSSTASVPRLGSRSQGQKAFRLQRVRWLSVSNLSLLWCHNIPTKYLYSLLVLNIHFTKHLRYANLHLEKAGTSISKNECQSGGQGEWCKFIFSLSHFDTFPIKNNGIHCFILGRQKQHCWNSIMLWTLAPSWWTRVELNLTQMYGAEVGVFFLLIALNY